MNEPGSLGVVHGKRYRTTIADADADRLLDRVNRQFVVDRSNQLCIADMTYINTWQKPMYAAFVIDVFSRMIVG